jgi:hypothetical protein
MLPDGSVTHVPGLYRPGASGPRPSALRLRSPAPRHRPVAPRLQAPACRLQPAASRAHPSASGPRPLACPRSPLACAGSPLASEGLPLGGAGHQDRRGDARRRGGELEDHGAMRRTRRQRAFFHPLEHSLPARIACEGRSAPHGHRAAPRMHTDENVSRQGRVWSRSGHVRMGNAGPVTRRSMPAARPGLGKVVLGRPSSRAQDAMMRPWRHGRGSRMGRHRSTDRVLRSKTPSPGRHR